MNQQSQPLRSLKCRQSFTAVSKYIFHINTNQEFPFRDCFVCRFSRCRFSVNRVIEAANRQVSTYSGGMKRRVNLIAGILHSPKILFLDEPTVGVDVQSRNVIIDHLKKINEAGTTIIYTSHHMEEAENFCNRVSIIDHGRILIQGTPAELIESTAGADNLEKVFLQLTKRKLRD